MGDPLKFPNGFFQLNSPCDWVIHIASLDLLCKWSRPCLPGLVTFMAASWTSLERKTRARLQGVEGRHSYPTLFVWEKHGNKEFVFVPTFN